MPEVNGIQLLNYVKGDEALRSVPVISAWPPAAAGVGAAGEPALLGFSSSSSRLGGLGAAPCLLLLTLPSCPPSRAPPSRPARSDVGAGGGGYCV